MNINNFNLGLILGPSPDKLPPGSCQRFRGISPLSDGSARSRFGSAQISALKAHSIFYFGNNYYYGVSTSLYKESVSIKSSLSGNRISFTKMPPVAGVADYLFCAEGSELFKVDSSGNITDWGFAAPLTSPTAASDGSFYISIRNATYRWTLSAAGTAEYYCELIAGGDPSLPEPEHILVSYVQLSLETLGILTPSSFAYGDNDSLGFSTIYIRLSDDVDPDTRPVGSVSYTDVANLPVGTVSYAVTYKNSTTGHRSNSSSSVPVKANYTKTQLTFIPDPTGIDSQIDKVEIWRSESNGTVLFYLDEVNAGTTTYTDDGSTSLSVIQLLTDNDQPYSFFTDCYGPYNASMFWITDTEEGSKGLLYYSPVGRAESMEGFVQITSDDDPLQKVFEFSSQLGVISQSGIFIINGTNPYYSRRIKSCPGTTSGDTVVTTPIGVFYEASDGIRLFNGVRSTIVIPGAVERIFLGESRGDFTSFTGTVAAYCRDEYIITDGFQSIAYDTGRQRFRDLGVGFNAIFYNEETKQITATLNSVVVEYEKESEISDNGSTFPISIEPPHFLPSGYRESLLQHLIFDIDTSSLKYTVTLIHDGVETIVGVLQSTSRQFIEINIGISAKQFGVRITGDCNAEFELFEIIADVYIDGGRV